MHGAMQERQNHWKRAQDYGIDMQHLAESLEKTPTERARAHFEALALAETLRAAGEKYYAQLRSKEKMGRPKDKEAIVQLRAIKDSAK